MDVNLRRLPQKDVYKRQVLEGTIQVNESLLTGEADEIEKTPGSRLMSGSFVVSGECYARLEKVGKHSYISRLTAEAKAMGNEEQSEMIRSINQLVKWIGIVIIPIGIILFWQGSVSYTHLASDRRRRENVPRHILCFFYRKDVYKRQIWNGAELRGR